jgi:hypothetical protein
VAGIQARCRRYLDSSDARAAPEERARSGCCSGFMFDVHRAVRLAKKHGKHKAAMQLLLMLRSYDDALAVAETYDERLSVVEEVCCACTAAGPPPHLSRVAAHELISFGIHYLEHSPNVDQVLDPPTHQLSPAWPGCTFLELLAPRTSLLCHDCLLRTRSNE